MAEILGKAEDGFAVRVWNSSAYGVSVGKPNGETLLSSPDCPGMCFELEIYIEDGDVIVRGVPYDE